ncbi:MAG: NAD(P)H-hydrate dehydratase, partial [Limnobacter sp.]
GSGDVLAGAVAAMLGQGLDEFKAASFAVYLHGLAVEPLGQEREGLVISHASEIAQRMKACLNHLLNQSARRNG